MPSRLATVIGWIEKSIPNEHNQGLVHRFVEYMQGTDTSEKYQRVNLIVIILFAEFLGPKLLSNIDRKDDVIGFLDTLKKDAAVDPDKRWIRTWNDYLQRIKHFMRWLHNDVSTIPVSEWQTPTFAQIKKKKSNRLRLRFDSWKELHFSG